MELEVKIRKKLRGFDLAVEFSVRDEVPLFPIYFA